MNIRRISLVAVPLLAALVVFAIVNAGAGAPGTSAQPPAKLALDMDPTNGDSPCNPVDDTRSVNAGDTYEVAFCLQDASNPPGSFNIEVLYDDTLDQCVPVDCPEGVGCVDTNPDANAGMTAWTSPDLGAGCDCSIGGELPPQCDRNPGETGPGMGLAFIQCYCPDPTLPVGEGVSSPLAMVTFKNVEKGGDTFNIGVAALYDNWIVSVADCETAQCSGGAVDSAAAVSPTPTVEGTPPAGTTPGGEVATPNPGAGSIATAAAATAVAQGTPIAAINQAATATSAAVSTKAAASAKTPGGKATAKPGSTGEEGGGSSGPNALLIAGIVIVGVIVVGGAGWFGYRRFRATR